MKRPTTLLILAAVSTAAVGLAVVMGLLGPLTTSDVARPPCEQLPSGSEVAAALDQHTDLTDRIEAAGGGVHVTSTTPCSDLPDRAIVTVIYRTNAERTRVDHILTTEDGFGVPVELVRDFG